MLPYRFLFVDLNSFFASVEQHLHPHLRGKPVAVVPVETDATCAIAASYEAKALGISTGTMIYEARRICPELVCVIGNHAAYVDMHHRIIEEIERIIPVYQVESIDEMSCELMGSQRSEAEAVRLAQAIKDGIAQHIGESIRSSIGISTNRFLAKVATDLKKPDGLVVLHPEDVMRRMGRKSVDVFPGIGRQMRKRLLVQGVTEVADLLRLSAKQMRVIWGSVEGERFWYKLRGVEIDTPETKKSTIGHSHILEPAFRPAALAVHVGQRLLLKAASRLRRTEFVTAQMVVSLRFESGEKRRAHVEFQPVCDNAALMHAFMVLWNLLVPSDEPRRIKKVAISLLKITPQWQKERQVDLFAWADAAQEVPSVDERKKQEKLSRAMDVLNQRYGRDTVVQGFLPMRTHGFSGTKIAFTRIPQIEEFKE